jgi:CheY-like chemotaxis protein
MVWRRGDQDWTAEGKALHFAGQVVTGPGGMPPAEWTASQNVAYTVTMTRILIVDDDPILQKVYHSKLTSEGFTAETVGDGAAALMAIASKPPDLVLLDLMLPGLSGIEVIRTVRARERGRRLPIVVLSNLYLESESDAASEAGADLVLTKAGITPRKVVDSLRGLLSVMAPPEAKALPITPPLPPPPGTIPLPASPGTTSSGTALPPPPGPVAPAPLAELPLVANPAIVRGAAALGIRPPAAARRDRPVSDVFLKTEAFLPQVEPLVTEARQWLKVLTQDPAALTNIGRTCKLIGNRAVMAQRWDVAKLAAAGESLVHQIKESPRYLTPSTVRTLTQTVERFTLLAKSLTESTDLAAVPTMVLDDEGVSRTTMGLALSKVGIQGTPFPDPRQALDALRQKRWQLILSDVMMGGMSGFQFAAAVRALPGYARTPIIFVTALADFESQFKASAHGADDLIGKPFLLMELGTKALLHVLTGDGDPWEGQR